MCYGNPLPKIGKDTYLVKPDPIYSALKLLLLPGLGVMLLYNAGIHPLSIEVAAILLGVPTATVSVIMSSEMEGDVKFASTAVTLSTLLSLLSLCLWSYLIGFLY
ncbi:MAG: hypothetical protein DRG73_09015 [Deltaproteobacteria bacterium]|nr:MAG: hypothetical protein DRG73_09015 [Deltaproteobacteria bacterium]